MTFILYFGIYIIVPHGFRMLGTAYNYSNAKTVFSSTS